MTSVNLLAALGSSFAAGPGIDPVEDAGAMRSARNYAHLAAAQLDAALVDLTVSGATTATILDTPQVMAGGATYPPQIDGLPADADLVTVTAGGNDLQFAGSMLFEAWSRADPGGPFVALMADEFADGIPHPTPARIEAMADGLARIVAQARHRAPRARVVLVDYLTVVGDETRTSDDWPLTDEQTAAFRSIQDAIAEGYRIAAQRSDAELLTASTLSPGHAIGSAEPWVFGFQPTLEHTAWSFHPNEDGMAAIADALLDLLRSEAE